MGPFWSHLFEDVGRQGRNGGSLFLAALAAGLLLAILIFAPILGGYLRIAVGLAAFVALANFWQAVRRARKDGGRYLIQPLSREEMRRARSKLVGNQPERKL
jgi:hypothetical protein